MIILDTAPQATVGELLVSSNQLPFGSWAVRASDGANAKAEGDAPGAYQPEINHGKGKSTAFKWAFKWEKHVVYNRLYNTVNGSNHGSCICSSHSSRRPMCSAVDFDLQVCLRAAKHHP